jgi:hypothetical protein
VTTRRDNGVNVHCVEQAAPGWRLSPMLGIRRPLPRAVSTCWITHTSFPAALLLAVALLGLSAGAAAATGSGPPVNTVQPSISGTPKDGQTLKAGKGTWTGPVNSTDATPVAVLHRFYSEGRLKVLGNSDLEGRSVWRLEVQRDPAAQSQTVNGRPVPAPTVLVDAKTFVPIENVIYSAGTEGRHQVLQSTRVRYATYRELPASPADERLLSLASHPGARMVAER